MRSITTPLAFAIAFAGLQVPALALPTELKRGTYPFNRLVAFGDELSDNGNGSYAHGITGSPANVYGFGTWTNGPVAVQYLAGLLNVPLVDYAFGGCCGGGSFGATISNAYTVSKRPYLRPVLTLLPICLGSGGAMERKASSIGTRSDPTKLHPACSV